MSRQLYTWIKLHRNLNKIAKQILVRLLLSYTLEIFQRRIILGQAYVVVKIVYRSGQKSIQQKGYFWVKENILYIFFLYTVLYKISSPLTKNTKRARQPSLGTQKPKD